jgi:cathepsin A (carboxypeptidase C)
MRFTTVAAIALCLVLSVCSHVAADQITSLPGLDTMPSYNMYSGYLTLPSGTNTFYWFAESQNDPKNDPVIMWTNGGPGCSGLSGLLTENGMFSVQEDGTLKENKFSWNKMANVVFIEAPVGVGFSHGPVPQGGYTDKSSTGDMADFAEKFFQEFDKFAGNDFYLASESYGGHYLPLTALTLAVRGSLSNFEGFLVGNPLTYMPYRNYGQYGTLWGHQLIPAHLWDSYNANHCMDGQNPKCAGIENQMEKITRKLNPYALDFPVCPGGGGPGMDHQAWTMRTLINKANTARRVAAGVQDAGPDWNYWPDDYEACTDSYAADWLNRDDVQKALSAVPTKWRQCNNTVSNLYSMNDINAPMMNVYKQLFKLKTAKNTPYKVMIYSGDDDTVCSTMGTQQFIWHPDFATVVNEWTAWEMNNQTYGYLTEFKELTFVTIHGAGHMVPSTRPEQAFNMLKNFLQDKW